MALMPATAPISVGMDRPAAAAGAAPAEEDPVAAVEPIGLTASAGFGAAATVQVCVLFSVLEMVSTAAVAEPEAPPRDSVDVEFAASGAPTVGPDSLSQ